MNLINAYLAAAKQWALDSKWWLGACALCFVLGKSL